MRLSWLTKDERGAKRMDDTFLPYTGHSNTNLRRHSLASGFLKQISAASGRTRPHPSRKEVGKPCDKSATIHDGEAGGHSDRLTASMLNPRLRERSPVKKNEESKRGAPCCASNSEQKDVMCCVEWRDEAQHGGDCNENIDR